MSDYDDLRDAVETDTDKTTDEKETGILFSSNDERLNVHSAEKSLMRRLLAHPEFELRRYVTSGDGEYRYRSVEADEYDEHGHDGRKPVWEVFGTLPIGVLKVSAKPRRNNHHSGVVSNHVPEDDD